MPNHDKAKRGIPPKSDFNAWYPAIVEIADLVDKRYPIKGMDVWRPYGWKAMKRIDALLMLKWRELVMTKFTFHC